MTCPIPLRRYPRITMGHGGGGRLTHDLVEHLFAPAFGMGPESGRHDGAALPRPDAALAFTTDAHVVDPLFFPGGDIGALSVYGTVNDLAMCGARATALSCAFVLEEGLPMETLTAVVASMARAAQTAAVRIVAGDTKVVPRGKADGLYLTTAGVGEVLATPAPHPSQVRDGDAVWVSGDVGRHGIAVLAHREGLAFESALESDCACVAGTALGLIEAGVAVRCLRDLTRGGLATALAEIAGSSGRGIEIDERAVPVSEAVRGASEMLGFDPLHLPCEGRFVAFVGAGDDARVGALLGDGAARIGTVGGSAGARLRGALGVLRPIERLSGEMLPRIC